MKKILFLFILLCSFSSFSQRGYKELMEDYSINFYEVCEVADAHFETVDKNAKGSGWKQYQRWIYQNEPKFYPSGDRSNYDPLLAAKEYERIKADPTMTNNAASKNTFTNGWEEVGPFNIDFSPRNYAPGLGRLECFYVNPDNVNLMYLGTKSGG